MKEDDMRENINELQHEEVLKLCLEESRLSPPNKYLDEWIKGWELELRLMGG